ncbi:MAG: NUMOD3 domain-containing DNA-binding protein [Patescibacteria group bacterium]|jgi:hypothetical protein
MTYLSGQEELFYRNKEKVLVKCDNCNKEFKILYAAAQVNLRKNGRHLCLKCKINILPKRQLTDEHKKKLSDISKKIAGKKPQCCKEFWTENKRKEHSEAIKCSEKYKEARKNIDMSGSQNGMFGKKHSIETRAKMSKSRIGKVGHDATAWKGGKASLTRRVKYFLNKICKWYYNVFVRDEWKCRVCGSKNKIDAHHIKPVVIIIKDLCKDKSFIDEQEKYNWLITQSELLDPEFKNGITLCREHHRSVHQNWGSHTNPNERKK